MRCACSFASKAISVPLGRQYRLVQIFRVLDIFPGHDLRRYSGREFIQRPLAAQISKFTNKGLTDAVSVIQSLPKAISGIV